MCVLPQLLWLHVQEVEYVKQEAKIVYLLECLQARLAQYTTSVAESQAPPPSLGCDGMAHCHAWDRHRDPVR